MLRSIRDPSIEKKVTTKTTTKITSTSHLMTKTRQEKLSLTQPRTQKDIIPKKRKEKKQR